MSQSTKCFKSGAVGETFGSKKGILALGKCDRVISKASSIVNVRVTFKNYGLK